MITNLVEAGIWQARSLHVVLASRLIGFEPVEKDVTFAQYRLQVK